MRSETDVFKCVNGEDAVYAETYDEDERCTYQLHRN